MNKAAITTCYAILLTTAFQGLESADDCNDPLGVADPRRIGDEYFGASSTYGDEFVNYGPHKARLNGTGGYRAGLDKSTWILVLLPKEMVVTAIATQGYGDPKVKEWVTQYMILYKDHNNNSVQVRKLFLGNTDNRSIKENKFPLPFIATEIFMVKVYVHNNFALRMELYGCQPGYYIKVCLLDSKDIFKLPYMDMESDTAKDARVDLMNLLREALEDTYGYLRSSFIGFSPQESSPLEIVQVGVEYKIECLKSEAALLVNKLKQFIGSDEEVFHESFMELQYPFNSECFPPNITINVSRSSQNAPRVTTLEPAIIQAAVQLRCIKTRDVEHRWDISSINSKTGAFSAFVTITKNLSNIDSNTRKVVPYISISADKNTIAIHPGHLTVGLHYIRLTINTRNYSEAWNYDFGFLRVVRPNIEAQIIGPTSVAKFKDTVTLRADNLFDPELKTMINSTGYIFTWFCRREGENHTAATNSTPVDFAHGRIRGVGGCFGYGSGKFTKQNNVLIIDPTWGMQTNRTYTIELLASNEERRSQVATHKLFVTSGLQASVRCISNCGLCARKVTADKRVVMETVCEGAGCETIKEYKWKLFLQEGNKWTEVHNLQEMVSSSLDGPVVVLSGSPSLRANAEYKFVSSLFFIDETTEHREITFHTNALPKSSPTAESKCFVSPQRGQAVIDDFVFKCEGYTDEDLPLSYQFSLSSPTGLVLFQSGFSPSATARLPLGDPENDYSTSVNISIVDAYGAAIRTTVYVQVVPLETNDMSGALMNVASGENSQLGNLLKGGDVGKASQMSYAVLSVVDGSKDKMAREDKKQLKNTVINQMSQAILTRLVQLPQMAAVVATATKEKEEISLPSQENAVGILENAVSVFSVYSNGSEGGLMQNVGEGLIRGTANIIEASSSETDINVKNKATVRRIVRNSRSADHRKRKEMTEKSLRLVDQVGVRLLGTKFPGEEPSVLKTDTLAVLLERQLPDKMGHRAMKEEGSEVILPSANDLFGTSTRNLASVDSQMVILKKNPFNWEDSSSAVRSAVIEFSLKTNTGKRVNVSGLRKPVELFIPIKKQNSVNKTAPTFFIKPSVKFENLRYHQFDIPSSEVTVMLRIQPKGNKSLDVYVGRNGRPNPSNGTEYFSKTMPDYSSCLNYSHEGEFSNCTSDPYVVVLSSQITGGVGRHYIGIRYLVKPFAPTLNNPEVNITEDDTSRPSVRERRSAIDLDCATHYGRQKRSCIGVKPAPTTPPPTPKIIVPSYNNSTDLNYTMTTSVAGCLYWSEAKKIWTSEGCQVGMKSTSESLHCLCTHLSAFGGDFFVESNPIDFDKVWLEFGNIGETKNYVVLSTVCTIWMLYILFIILARRADKDDQAKAFTSLRVTELIPEGNAYEINIHTGMWKNFGTTANVGVIVYGEEGCTLPILLPNSDSGKKFFARGSVNSFMITTPESLGNLFKVKIWHDNSGSDPSWFLQMVTITDIEIEEKYHFLANRWLAVEKEDGNIETELMASTERDLSKLRNLFCSRSAEGFSDKHLWLSVFTRPPHNLFTRCQRLSCCLSILFAAMVTNAMFYQIGAEPPTETFRIGPLKLSWRQIKIGIQSGLVAIPVNVIVVTIFRNTKQLTNEKVESEGTDTPGCFPHWFIYVGWSLCIVSAVTSSAFIVFYSMMWGAQTSNEWLTSISVSLFQDIIVTQPIKVIITAFLLSLIFKKLPQQKLLQQKTPSSNTRGERRASLPSKEDLETSKQFRTKKIAMLLVLKDIALFILFVVLLSIVMYGNRTNSRFLLTNTMEQTFSKVEKVQDTHTFWWWVKTKLIPGLYSVGWYNGQSFDYNEGFISNRYGFLVGMPRMRQIRMKPDTECNVLNVLPIFERILNRCIPPYTHTREDMALYNKPGWDPIKNISRTLSIFEFNNMCPIPWRYQSSQILHGLPYWGYAFTYDGGGFVADLGYNEATAVDVVVSLENNNWVDDRTAALFVEFTVFDASSALFASVKYLYERLPTGGWHPFTKINALTVYSSQDKDNGFFYGVCQLLLKINIAFFLVAELIKLFVQGVRKYFTIFWNWIELFQIAIATVFLVTSFLKETFVSKFVKRVKDNPFQTSNTDYLVLWSDVEVCLLSIVAFVATIKFLRLFRFNSHICYLMGTLQRSARPLMSYFIMFLLLVLSYTQLGWLIFGSSVPAYSTFFGSLRALLQMIIGGDVHFVELQSNYRFLAPIFIFLYVVSMSMILINVFLIIIIDSYMDVKEIGVENLSDMVLAAFMKDYFKSHIEAAQKKLTMCAKRIFCTVRHGHCRKGLGEDAELGGYVTIPTDEVTRDYDNYRKLTLTEKTQTDKNLIDENRIETWKGVEPKLESMISLLSAGRDEHDTSSVHSISFLNDIKGELLDALLLHKEPIKETNL